MSTSKLHSKRSGTVVVLSLFLMVGMLGIVALAVDVGYLQVVNSEMQRSADAAAIAATWKLLDEHALQPSLSPSALDAVRSTASDYAGRNQVGTLAPALSTDDVQAGYLPYPFSRTGSLSTSDPTKFNAVTVRLRRTADQNGEVGLFFARVFGQRSSSMQLEATAAFIDSIIGFKSPSNGENLAILPLALDKETWDALLAGQGSDNYKFDPATGEVVSGTDGKLEANLYPQGTGSPGNRGTVRIGRTNNSTADLSRQIREGISKSEMDLMGGSIQLNPDTGTLLLGGDPGISAGIKDDLASIIGKPRIIPIFTEVSGNGNNAQYTIVAFVGIRLVAVDFSGSSKTGKKVLFEPAAVVTPGAIPASDAGSTSLYVYSPVWLVR